MEAKQIQLKPLLLSMIAIAVIETTAAWAAPPPGVYRLLLVGVVRLAEICVLTGVLYRWGHGLPSIGLEFDRWGFGLRMGLIWSMGFAAAAAASGGLLLVLGVNPMKFIGTPMAEGVWESFLLVLVGGLIAPVAEEIFFRGLVFGFFRRWGFPLALVVSTALFVVIHPIGGGVPVIQVVGGIVFAAAYERERSLLTPITIHCLGNTALFSLSLILPA